MGAQPRPSVYLLVVVTSRTRLTFSDFYAFWLKEPRGSQDSK